MAFEDTCRAAAQPCIQGYDLIGSEVSRCAADRHFSQLAIDQPDVTFVGGSLAHAEDKLRNSARSRNACLAAIRSFFRFVAMKEPAYPLHCRKIPAMSGKRCVRRTVEFPDRPEMNTLLAAPDRFTWVGLRDQAMLRLALQTDSGPRRSTCAVAAS
jgi:site-specific recombinase XerD